VVLSHKLPAETPSCLDIMVVFGIMTIMFADKIFANMPNNTNVYLLQHLVIAIGMLLINNNHTVPGIQCKQLALLANNARIWEVTIKFMETNVQLKHAQII
jgi:intracellular septation protein A